MARLQRKNLFTLAKRLDEVYFKCEVIDILYMDVVLTWLEQNCGHGLNFRSIDYDGRAWMRSPNWIMEHRGDIFLADPDHIYLFKVQGF